MDVRVEDLRERSSKEVGMKSVNPIDIVLAVLEGRWDNNCCDEHIIMATVHTPSL